jgi:hypothetical protein
MKKTPPWFALGEVALLWLGALVGPMLVVRAVAGAAWGLGAGLIVGLVCLGLLLGAALLVRRSPQPAMEEPTSVPPSSRDGDGGSRLLIAAVRPPPGPRTCPPACGR